MNWKWFLAIPAILLILYSSIYTVDATEYAYLTRFGRPIAIFDGSKDSEAGLHWKWPWPVETVARLDRRLQSFDLPGAELLTRDPGGNTIDKTLTIDAYVCWRIADSEGADRFIRAVGSLEGARLILGQRITSELGAAIATMELDDLISTDADKVRSMRERLRERLLDGGKPPSLRESAKQSYGIEVVDVRLRRSNHPVAVREAIFDRIRSERAIKVAFYQSEGQRLALDIRSASEREVAEMKSDAEARAIELRGQADAAADRIRYEAQRADPQFYAFLKKMEDYQRILGDGKTMLLLSTHRDWFDLLTTPPTPGAKAERPAAALGTTAKRPNYQEAGMRFFRILLVAALVLYLLTGLVRVRNGERAVVRRFGRILQDHPRPGLWVGLPWGMDRVERVEVDTVRNVVIGYNEEETADIPAGQLLTGDHNLVNVQVVLYYKVRPDEVAQYVMEKERVPGVLARAAEATVAEWVGGRGVDDVLLNGKNTLRDELIESTRKRIEPYQLGVELLDARVALIAPPEEVKDAFDSVARAQTGMATARYQAEQEASTRLRMARAERYRIEQSAAAYKHDRKVIAEQDAKRFLARLKQYQAGKAKDPHYLETIWQEERSRLFATLKDKGQIDLLDHHLGQGGLDIVTAPRLPEKR